MDANDALNKNADPTRLELGFGAAAVAVGAVSAQSVALSA